MFQYIYLLSVNFIFKKQNYFIQKFHYLIGIHNCSYANSKGLLRNLVDIVAKESCICQNSLLVKCLHSGSRDKTRTRFIESNMTIGANSLKKKKKPSFTGFIYNLNRRTWHQRHSRSKKGWRMLVKKFKP